MSVKTLRNVFLGASVVLAFLGCASLTTPSVQNQNQVYAAGRSLALLGQMVTVYDNLPPCPQPSPQVCSTLVMKQNLAKGLIPAVQAYLAAQAAVQAGQAPDMAVLDSAITVLQNLTATLPKQ